MNTKTMNRRRFLAGALAAGTSVMLPLPRMAQDMNMNGDAFADGTPMPGKFGLWFFGNGIDPAIWHPQGGGGRGAAWQLTEQLAPLTPFKSHTSVLSGYEIKTGGAHVGGSAGATTGASPDEFGSARLPSIDQLIAQQIGGNTPFSSIEVGLSRATPAGPQPTLHTISHRGPASPNYPEFNPHRLFARLFGLSTAAPEVREAKRSVLDAVLQDLKALSTSVGADDRRRLEAHTEGVRALERRLASAPSSCGLIEAPGPEVQEDRREEAPWILNDAMSQMIAMAMACDLTNVFSYVFTLPAGHVYYRHLGEEFNRSFHEDIVHLVDALPNGYGMVRDGVTYTLECLAKTLEHFQNTPVAGGGTLLDEICMLSTSEVSYGWTHEMNDLPVLVFGKGGGKLAGDLHHVAPDQRTFSEVLLTMAQLMGVQMDALGLDGARAETSIVQELA